MPAEMNESVYKRKCDGGTPGQPTHNSSPSAPPCVVRASGRRAASHKLVLAAFAFVLLSSSAQSATSVSTIDGGGQRALSANYSMNGSISSIGGISTAAAPALTARHGYIGQLYDVTGLEAAAIPNPVSESSSAQLSATALLDDATVIVLSGSSVNWSSSDEPYPIVAINAGGTVTAATVYTNAIGAISGYYLGASNTVSLVVIDTNPDDYGIYAGDGVPDSWQVQYFGLNNSSGVAIADPDGDGQNNLQEFLAGTDPTNDASLFRVIGIVRQSQDMRITWAAVGGKRYILQATSGLSGSFSTNDFVDLNPAASVPGTGATTFAVLHLGGATNRPAFYYRIRLVP